MSDPTPPAVSEAMREAVARDDAREKLISGIVTRYVADCTLVHRTLTQEDIWLLEGLAFGPIASEIGRLTGERDAAVALAEAAERNLMARLKTSRWNAMEGENGNVFVCHGHHEKSEDCDWVEYVPAEAAEAETARLRAALKDLREVSDDLAELSIKEGDNKTAGALQYVSGFISDRLAALTSQEQADV